MIGNGAEGVSAGCETDLSRLKPDQIRASDMSGFIDPNNFLGTIVHIIVDRKIGSTHPVWGFVYPVADRQRIARH
jgi:hypothetical protein